MKQNLGFALLYNGLGLPVAAGALFPFFGLLLSPILAALAMSLSSASVVGNALRLRGHRNIARPASEAPFGYPLTCVNARGARHHTECTSAHAEAVTTS